MRNILIIILTLLSCTVQSQDFDSIRKNLEERYQYVSDLKNNIAVFRTKQGKMGLLDSKGNEIVPAAYNYVNINFNGFIEAGNNIKGKFKRGYLNRDGSVKIPFVYDYVFQPSKSSLIIVGNDAKKGAIDTLGNIVIPINYDSVKDTDENGNLYIIGNKNLYAIYNNKGEAITGFIFSDVTGYQEGLSPVNLPNKSTSIIDRMGKYLFPPIPNHSIRLLDNDNYKIDDNKTGLSGLINEKGTLLIPCLYDDINYANGVAIVKQKNKYGLRTISNTEITPIIYTYLLEEPDGLFKASLQELWGVIDPSGKIIIPIKYTSIITIEDKYFITNNTGIYGVYNTKGNLIIPEEYTFFRAWKHQVFAEKDGKPIIIDITNPDNPTKVIQADRFKNTVPHLSEEWDKQIFEKDGKYGVLSIDNKILIPAKYDNIESIYISGEFIVKLNGKYGIVNTRDEIIKPIQFDIIDLKKEVAILHTKNKQEYYNVKYRDYKN